MNRLCLTALLACAAASSTCLAQSAPASAGPAEPEVRSGVIEDEGSRIEELRVRGQAQRIVVLPKVGPRARYEIITGDGSRNLTDAVDSARGATGKRVWHVLSF